MYNVSSLFQKGIEDRASAPVRTFQIGTSNYSNRVAKWPRIKRTYDNIRTAKPVLKLNNADGALNTFYESTYKMVQKCSLKLSFVNSWDSTGGAFCNSIDLFAYWPFDEGSGDVTSEWTDTYSEASLHNMTTVTTELTACEVISYWTNNFNAAITLNSSIAYSGSKCIQAQVGATHPYMAFGYKKSDADWTECQCGMSRRAAHAGCVSGDAAYIYGGFYYGGSFYQDMWRYNITSDTWTQRASDTTDARFGASAVADIGYIFIHGGYRKTGVYRILKSCRRFDITNNSWVALADSPHRKYGHSAVVTDHKMYVFGGEAPSGLLNLLSYYNIANNTWTSVGSGATARKYHASVYCDNRIFIFGGTDGANTLNDLWQYHITSDTWTECRCGATPRVAMEAVLINGVEMLIFGGYDGAVDLNDTWIYNIASDSWTEQASYSTVAARQYYVGFGYNNKAYFHGGQTVTSSGFNDLFRFDINPLPCAKGTGLQWWQKSDVDLNGRLKVKSSNDWSQWDINFNDTWTRREINYSQPDSFETTGVDIDDITEFEFTVNSGVANDKVWVDELDTLGHWRTGQTSGALYFADNSEYVCVGSGNLNPVSPCTFTCRLKSDKITDSGVIITGGTWANPHSYLHLFVNGNGFLGHFPAPGFWAVSSDSIDNGEWHTAGITIPASGEYGYFFIDGEPNGGFISTGANSSEGGKYIGNDSTHTHGFHGLLEDCRIYNRVLENNEMLSLFTGEYPPRDYIEIFKGSIDKVQYSDKICAVTLADKTTKFSQLIVGDNEAPAIFSDITPSHVGWTLCTCYGGLCDSMDVANEDIDYKSFLTWAEQMSTDNITVSAEFENSKITQALNSLAKVTQTAIWAEGNGKIYFKKFTSASSLSTTVTADDFTKILINISNTELVNQARVLYDYSVESDYWANEAVSTNSISVNSFGLHEQTYSDDTVWFVDNQSAVNIGQRAVMALKDPPKTFRIDTDLCVIRQQIGETIILVDSFYQLSEEAGWQLKTIETNMEKGTIKLDVGAVETLNAFFLDINFLDGDEQLL